MRKVRIEGLIKLHTTVRLGEELVFEIRPAHTAANLLSASF